MLPPPPPPPPPPKSARKLTAIILIIVLLAAVFGGILLIHITSGVSPVSPVATPSPTATLSPTTTPTILANATLSPGYQTVTLSLGQSPSFNLTIAQIGYTSIQFPFSIGLVTSVPDVNDQQLFTQGVAIFNYGTYQLPDPNELSSAQALPQIENATTISFYAIIEEPNGNSIISNTVIVQYQ
jgi:hypothetical protein